MSTDRSTLPVPPGQQPPASTAPALLPPWPGPSAIGALRLIGGIGVLGLLIAAASTVVAQFFTQQQVQTVSLPVGLTAVTAATDLGSVHVRVAAAGERPQLEMILRWSFDRPSVQQAVTPDTEQVQARCPQHWMPGACSVDLMLVVPASTALQLSSQTGEVFVGGTSGALAAATSTGRITLSAVSGTTLSARTDTGDVRVLATGQDQAVIASTDTGRVDLSFAKAPRSVRASTSTGDVSITLPSTDSYAVTTRTDVGGASVMVPNDPSATRTVSASTSVGDIQIQSSDH